MARFSRGAALPEVSAARRLAAARARGRKGGPKFKMTPTRIAQARAMYDDGKHTVQQIADTFGCPGRRCTGI